MNDGLKRWVGAAPVNQTEFRQAVSIILMAVSADRFLKELMIMKGGLLLAIKYRSQRFTKDIDFSASSAVQDHEFRTAFEHALELASAESAYGVECRIQGFERRPKSRNATFPGLKLKIGYARKGTPKHARLQRCESPDVVPLDLSLNETICSIEDWMLEESSVKVYAQSELIAEKYRALLQQVDRNRYRRQDVYDLNFMIGEAVEDLNRPAILNTIIQKCTARDIFPDLSSLDHPEIYARAKAEYATLEDEVAGPLPDFDASYNCINAFYKSLPW